MTRTRGGPFRRLSKLYYGWRMVGLLSLIRTIGGGVHGFGFTVFFLPVSAELGISRAATSFAFSLARAEGAIEGPLAGWLIDRFGAKPVIFTATLLCGVGYLLLAGIDGYAGFVAVYVGVVSLAFIPGFVHAPAVLITRWFTRYRARALTCLSAAMPIGGVLVTPLLALALQAWGWRTAAALTGCLFLAAAAPLTLGIRPSPESMGLPPDGDGAPPPAAGRGAAPGRSAPESRPEPDYTVRGAMRTSVFWLFVLWMTARSAAYTIVIVHFVPLMVWKGMTEQGAAFLLSGFAFMNIVAHFVLGWIADRTNKMRLVTRCMALSSIAVLPLLWSDALWGSLLFAALFSVLDASIPVVWAAVGDFFGRRRFGSIRGNMSFFYMWGSFAGPTMAGVIYDRYGSYAGVLWLLLGLVAVSGAATGRLVGPWSRLGRGADGPHGAGADLPSVDGRPPSGARGR